MHSNQKQNLSKVKKALAGKKISKATDDQLSVMLHDIMIYIGATDTQIPSGSNRIKLFKALRRTLGTSTIEQVILSFEYAMTGEIHVEMNLFTKPISVLYISKILIAFNIYTKTLRKQHFIFLSENREQKESKPPSREQQFIAYKQSIVENYTEFIKADKNPASIRNIGGVYSRFIYGLNIWECPFYFDDSIIIERARKLYVKKIEGTIMTLDTKDGNSVELSDIAGKIYEGKEIKANLYAAELETIHLIDFFTWIHKTRQNIDELIQTYYKNFKL